MLLVKVKVLVKDALELEGFVEAFEDVVFKGLVVVILKCPLEGEADLVDVVSIILELDVLAGYSVELVSVDMLLGLKDVLIVIDEFPLIEAVTLVREILVNVVHEVRGDEVVLFCAVVVLAFLCSEAEVIVEGYGRPVPALVP